MFLVAIDVGAQAGARYNRVRKRHPYLHARSMGNVGLGSSKSILVTITNTGMASVTISAGSVTGAEFSVITGMLLVITCTDRRPLEADSRAW